MIICHCLNKLLESRVLLFLPNKLRFNKTNLRRHCLREMTDLWLYFCEVIQTNIRRQCVAVGYLHADALGTMATSTGGVICSPCPLNFKDTSPIHHPTKCHACKNDSRRPVFTSLSVSFSPLNLWKTWTNGDRESERESSLRSEWVHPAWTALRPQSASSLCLSVFMHMEYRTCFDWKKNWKSTTDEGVSDMLIVVC